MPQGFAFLCGFPAIVTEKEHRVSSAQDIWKAITRERVIWFKYVKANNVTVITIDEKATFPLLWHNKYKAPNSAPIINPTAFG